MEESTRSWTVALYTSSYAVGAELSSFFIGQLSQALDWRWAFGLSAIGPVFVFVLVVILFHSRMNTTHPSKNFPANP